MLFLAYFRWNVICNSCVRKGLLQYTAIKDSFLMRNSPWKSKLIFKILYFFIRDLRLKHLFTQTGISNIAFKELQFLAIV